ncbi:pyrroline-5-carboxylate reductase [Apilactobacillus xinyiensis]|uniref:pyrroline-5-carboxylate reductase n=1 Tax=Apilactobacillus xinyiensis TaxID=2841032 RepID=UPI001C7D0A8F|nr:pyrroline-5-carboxylate reductase [Apilactobacillus xinyiensis]MCL0312717.1 pyrroline-5-carboxylate reductase [Apilactobacillus xinyiensis]MCL0319108.1 pyrroline-5-carboxylate reductase [Apilactobacillus xinyiensis]MCL0330343.1 pyrroline-5-carboxylate reductase [Apilactobacillus xinyiensis]
MNIGFIGVGNMAKAIIKGMVASKSFDSKNIFVHSRNKQKYEKFANEYNLTSVDNNVEVVDKSDFVFLAVTPNAVQEILSEVREHLSNDKVLISIVSGLTIDRLEELTSYDQPILRTLPNINSSICEGLTVYKNNKNLSGDLRDKSIEILNSFGSSLELPETNFDIAGILGGCTPAYAYLFVDSLSRVGVKYGLTKDQATKIAAKAVLGSSKMVMESDETPYSLIDDVCSPGGDTIKGLLSMEEHGFQKSITKGIDSIIKDD